MKILCETLLINSSHCCIQGVDFLLISIHYVSSLPFPSFPFPSLLHVFLPFDRSIQLKNRTHCNNPNFISSKHFSFLLASVLPSFLPSYLPTYLPSYLLLFWCSCFAFTFSYLIDSISSKSNILVYILSNPLF